jgi:hypothetical protein
MNATRHRLAPSLSVCLLLGGVAAPIAAAMPAQATKQESIAERATVTPQEKIPAGLVQGLGTPGTIPKWVAPRKLGDSVLVESGGSVGIGTASPSARLEVVGTARVNGRLTLAPAGDQALDVSTGSIYKSGALFIHTRGGGQNAALGPGALANVTTGSGNTATGEIALHATTAGDHNTGNGLQALFDNTTGSFNTASGANALRSNTTGFDNTAIGSTALYSNTTGGNNTATGKSALFSNTTGLRNTASGAHALFSNTTAYNNTAVGFYALRTNTYGSYNTATGSTALLANTTGTRNTATGAQALRSNTTAVHNTATGFRALYANTSGYENVAVGSKAMFNNTYGQRNTAAGYRALYSQMFGSNNVAIGISSLFTNSSGSYNVAIGDSALYSNTTGSGNIGIGVFGGIAVTGSSNIVIGGPGVGGESLTTRIGQGQTRAFIAGIRGVTTANANAVPVLIDSAGQLGTISSSRRFKEDVRDMEDATERLLDLRPVLFRYRGREGPDEVGLIAEEVAEVFPELVVHDAEGKPETVKYHLLGTMLLNELQRMQRELDQVMERLAALESPWADLR